MWKRFQKRRAMRRYRRRLGVKLRRRYGRERYYTPEQVRSTAISGGLGVDYMCFALAMYCDRESFDAYHRANGEVCDYDAMRADIGASYFGGDTNFDATSFDTLDDSYAVEASDGGSFGGGFDAGGFDGGGGGGDGGD
jgi:hypothetical protein